MIGLLVSIAGRQAQSSGHCFLGKKDQTQDMKLFWDLQETVVRI